jgi:alpha-mannosidase
MITVHLIFNAHIDPVWLWPWTAGLDEALATCRSACDRLDAHPDLIFARGEAWVYREVERLDPELFARIRAHVEAGRWEIVGGWWLQPDCNLPSRRGMERQIELGRAYFTDRFGPNAFPRIAYNVDSFGHAAALPGLMRAHGQDRYVMMRPQEHEMTLPARLFRWRGREDGPEVVTFRIARGYTTRHIDRAHVEASLTHLPPGVTDTMCFVGVGDHGGGPTEEQIAWCRANADAFPGARLVFSSPSRFFAAIEPHVADLPLVTGELQHHAVGCYSVYRPIKTAVQRAEHLLEQAETVVAPDSPEAARVTEAWERVCFAHFHDTLGGTCLPSAYPEVLDQVGYAATIADETLQYELRRRMRALPDDPRQRIVLWNPSAGGDWSGYVEVEPWLEWQAWRPEWGLVDEAGAPVPFQTMHSEAMARGITRLVFRVEIPAGQMRVLRIDTSGSFGHAEANAYPAETDWSGCSISTDSVAYRSNSYLSIEYIDGMSRFRAPRLALVSDETDTWSHQIDRYAEGPPASPRWDEAVAIDYGPLMASLVQTGRISDSLLRAEWRVYAGELFIDMYLAIHWRETRKVLKLFMPLFNRDFRVDGLMGETIMRANDGKELPLTNWILLPQIHDSPPDSAPVGVVCPDVFAADATPHRLRLTLLRSPYMAHHDPYIAGTHPRAVVSDQGVHTFRFRFFAGPDVTPELLESHARMMHRPPLVADLTRGMPTVRGVGGVG